MSNDLKYVSSTHPPLQVHSNVCHSWPLSLPFYVGIRRVGVCCYLYNINEGFSQYFSDYNLPINAPSFQARTQMPVKTPISTTSSIPPSSPTALTWGLPTPLSHPMQGHTAVPGPVRGRQLPTLLQVPLRPLETVLVYLANSLITSMIRRA